MIGMSATTGRSLQTLEHLRQSIRDILTTPLGSRVMRREYGSLLFALTDAPLDRVTVIDLIMATAGAIGRWEPRVRVERVTLDEAAETGKVVLNLELRYLLDGSRVRLEGIAV